MLLALGASGARYARAYLMKPIFDEVLLPHAAASVAADTAGLTGAAREISEPTALPDPTLRASLGRVAAIALVVIVTLPLFQLGRSLLIEWILGRVRIAIERDVFAKFLALPLHFHSERRQGDLLTRITSDVTSAHAAVRVLFGDFVESAIMIAVGTGFLIFISWQLALVCVVLGPALFAALAISGRRIRISARRRQEAVGDVNRRVVETLAGIKVIKAFRAEAAEDAAFRAETGRLFRRGMRVISNRVFARSGIELLTNGAVIGVVLFGSWLVLLGRFGLSAGDLAAFAAVLMTSYRPMRQLARGWVTLMDAEPSAERFLAVLDAPVELRDAPDAVAIDGVSRGVEFRDISFSYGREPVLRGVSFELHAGETVALVGRTGAGKTTLADLLMRFHDPTAGSIEIDGVDLRRIRRDALLRQVAVVTQDPFLFDGTIRDNIRYGRPEASDADVLASARTAHVDAFVDALPEGIDTRVGPAGIRLSGGQRQRIAIARAILRDPALLIFDEATSSLDARSERAVADAVDALLGGRTVLLIAHRLATIRRADRIVVLEGGRVREVGSHQELLRAGGLYRELFELEGSAPGAAI